MLRRKLYLLFAFFAAAFAYCASYDTPAADLMRDGQKEFLNTAEGTKYVGIETCKSCHAGKHATFVHTGMGLSFAPATRSKSAATFDAHSLVYDKPNDLYYFPFWRDSALYIREFRLQGGDTVHRREEKVAYIIGSGQHTNSHLLNINGYVYQAPITFYTQEKKWDLAPGFEGGRSSRFSRIITNECLTCHNHYPTPVVGAENKFAAMPAGIECERCHGAGELHVKAMLAGKTVDTTKAADYTIVNPRRLRPDLQLDLCQRCHLQGVAVLNDGRSWYDFRPAMPLRNVMSVFLPRYTNSSKHFIMASQADRMRLSPCYTKGGMTCITCHNPHVTVRDLGSEYFNAKCLACHKTKPREAICSAPTPDRQKVGDNCVSCHLPKRGSIDIPHVRISDHNVCRATATTDGGKGGNYVANTEKEAAAQFLGLQCLTENHAAPLTMAKGYLALYDKFVPDRIMLDSARAYLAIAEAKGVPLKARFATLAHLAFTNNDYPALVALAHSTQPDAVADAWTAYRLGEGLYQTKAYAEALPFLERAVVLLPYYLDFRNKLGGCYLALGKRLEARREMQASLKENPRQPTVLSNLGYLAMLEQQTNAAVQFYNRALALDPDYEQALLNRTAVYLKAGNKTAAKTDLLHLLQHHPDNAQARELLRTMM